MKTNSDENLAWLAEHGREVAEQYAGQWIAIVNGCVAATGTSAREAYEQAVARHGTDARPLLSFVEATADVIYRFI